jgi:crotonobetainyl-CoA:carnitine CoA-transferase CaiB-like acyl-CoA transferase
VTKVEPPGGDPLLVLSPEWHADLHAGIAIERLDLKSENGQARLGELLRDADVFITSQRPSTLARLSLDPDALHSRLPGVRILRIVGSTNDPERAGHDLTYQAQSGLLVEAMPRTLAADVMASERVFSGTLALLRQPPGSMMDVGLLESLEPLLASLRHGVTTPSAALGGASPQYRLYPTKAGYIAVAALEPHFEHRLYEQLGLPRGSDLSAELSQRTAEEWDAWARERDLPIVAVKQLE